MKHKDKDEIAKDDKSDLPESVVICGVGAATPASRVSVSEISLAWGGPSGKGTLAICGPDEDCLTLAWSAGQRAMRAVGLGPSEIDGMWWGTARPPMAEGPSYAFLAATLGLAESVVGTLTSGSVHAGFDALLSAWDSVVAKRCARALVVISDALVPGPRTGAEKQTGAGAVAYILESEKSSASGGVLVQQCTNTVPLLDRYRGDGDPSTGDPYDPRLYREQELIPWIKKAADALGDKVGSLATDVRWTLPDPDGRLGRVLAKSLGATNLSFEGVQARIGDTGSAGPFLGSLRAMTAPGPMVVIGTGGGRTTALFIEVKKEIRGAAHSLDVTFGEEALVRPMTYLGAIRARGQLVAKADPVAMGVPPGSAAFVRGNAEMLQLKGKKCSSCATIAVPPSIHPVCPTCGAENGEIVSVAHHGTIQTFVINHTMPPPFEAPLPMVVVDLEDGARVLLQGMPEDAHDIAIGDHVRLELRRYAVERGVPVYGYKVRRLSPGDVVADESDVLQERIQVGV